MKAKNILILGSAPNALRVIDWDLDCFGSIVAINNAWRISPMWTHSIFPSDFPSEKRPIPTQNHRIYFF